jgi:hypothetical protein
MRERNTTTRERMKTRKHEGQKDAYACCNVRRMDGRMVDEKKRIKVNVSSQDVIKGGWINAVSFRELLVWSARCLVG